MPIATKTGEVKFNEKIKQIPYDCGEYGNDNMTFTCTEFLAPYVYDQGEYYVMNKIGTWTGRIGGPTPKDDYASYGNRGMWLLMDKAKIAIFEAIIAEFARIGNVIFNGNYTYSHHGIDQNGNPSTHSELFDANKIGTPSCPFTPNVLINWLEGSIKALRGDFSGAITAQKLYTPFVQVPSGSYVWDIGQYSTNVIIFPGGMSNSLLTLPGYRQNSGVVLRILTQQLSRSSMACYISASPGESFRCGITSYHYYRLPDNDLTEMIAVSADDYGGWVVVNPDTKNFTNVLP